MEDVRRRYGSMSKYTRPYVAFIALDPRVSGERAKIEEWVRTLPNNIKPDFIGRLRDKNEEQHFSAYYELVIRHYFQTRGCNVTVNPELKEGKPDLLVEGDALGTPIIVEVATVFDDPEWRKESQKLNLILATLEEIKHYFFVMVGVRSDIPEKVDHARLKRFVEKWLDGLDPHVTKSEQEITYREGGLFLNLIMIPKKTLKKSSIVGAYLPQIRHVSATQLRRAIEKKINKYKSIKEQNLPYVVAACLHKGTLLDEEEALEVLFGKTSVTVDLKKKEAIEVKRDFSGLLTPKPHLGGLVQNTRLSALLIVRSKWAHPTENAKEYRTHSLRVLHNPNAAISLCFDPFGGYPQLIKIAETDKNVSLKWIDEEPEKTFV